MKPLIEMLDHLSASDVIKMIEELYFTQGFSLEDLKPVFRHFHIKFIPKYQLFVYR